MLNPLAPVVMFVEPHFGHLIFISGLDTEFVFLVPMVLSALMSIIVNLPQFLQRIPNFLEFSSISPTKPPHSWHSKLSRCSCLSNTYLLLHGIHNSLYVRSSMATMSLFPHIGQLLSLFSQSITISPLYSTIDLQDTVYINSHKYATINVTLAAIGTLQSILNIDNTVKTTQAGLQWAGEAMRGFSKESVIAALATQGLSEAQAEAILKAYGLSDAELQAALSTLASGQAADIATLRFKKFGMAIKAASSQLWAFLTTNPYGMAIAAAGMALAGVAVYNVLNETFKESAEKAQESAEAYSNTESEIASLNNQLQTTKDRIDELRAQGALSIADKSELEELQEQNKQLERQLWIKERLAENQQESAARDANNALTNKDFTIQVANPNYNSDYIGPEFDSNSGAALNPRTVSKSVDIINATTDAQTRLNEKL